MIFKQLKYQSTIFLLILISGLFKLNAQTPIVDFTVTQTTTCAGSPITFTDLTNYGGANIISTSWDFGEGGQSSDQNPTYTYLNPGTYQVLLTAISAGGTDFEIKLDYITVTPNPDVNFTPSGNGCIVPFDVTFVNSSSSGPEFSYAWDFGNGNTSTEYQPGAQTYNANGSYPTSLEVTNSTTGCTKTYIDSIVISDFNAGIDISNGCVNIVFQANDISTVGANNWSWTTSDGQSSTEQNPTFTFNSAGSYDVNLTSQNTNSGCASSTSVSVDVSEVPIPSFTSSTPGGCGPLNVTFSNTTNDVNATYTWDFGNGNSYSGQNPPVEIYTDDGVYSVSLSMDNNGCVGTTTIDSMITVGPPTANFTSDTVSGCDPLVVQFSDLSISQDPSDPIIDWQWNFGNGNTFNGQNPPPQTFTVGTYSVSLQVTTLNGCTHSLVNNNYIEVGAIDLVDFTKDLDTICAKNDVSFTNLTQISVPHDPNEISYTWDFYDGGTSQDANPIYNYPIDTGSFDVSLTVTFRGCELSMTKSNEVYINAPIARFSTSNVLCNPDPSMFPLTVNVTDDAIAGRPSDDVTMIWRWGIPDDPDDILNPSDIFDLNQGDTSHTFNNFGTYTIKQVVINNTTGCSDSVENQIFITNVDASFTLSTDTICRDGFLDLTSTSVYSHPMATFEYDMGNGDVLTDEIATYSYANSGSYDIQLVVTNSVGCSDTSIFNNFVVLSPPIAALASTDSAGCIPTSVDYTNLSNTQGNGLALQSFFWTFPDNSTQTTNSITDQTTYDFNSLGILTTTLVTTDIYGCVSEPASLDMLITQPVASNIMDTVICNSDSIVSWNNSTGYGNMTYDWYVDGTHTSNNINQPLSFSEVESPSYNELMHTIGLVATDENGCVDSISKNLHISLPHANFAYIASGATANSLGEYTCPPVFEDFNDLSTSYRNLSNWNWDFGDGKSSTFQNPSNTYVFPGTYTLSMQVTDEFGCSDDTVLVDYLTILGPQGDLTSTEFGDPCLLIYEFTVTNMIYVDSIVWDMGDGTIYYNNTIIQHTYAFGTYYPTCKLIDSLGCEVTYPLDTINANPIVLIADAGPDQEICIDSTSFNASAIQYGTGNWTTISGGGNIMIPDSINSPLINLNFGLHTYEWTVSNACETVRDTVHITYTDQASFPNAGPDQYLCFNNTNLSANEAILGVGNWSLGNGGATIIDPTDSLTQITNLAVGTNELIWTISNFCSSVSDTVNIVLETTPTTPNAGPDKQICGDNTQLEGNVPIHGNGNWSIISGSGVLNDSTSPTATISNKSVDSTVLIWTIANTCDTLRDTVIIERVTFATTANAGIDMGVCVNNAQLYGNEAVIGIGNWTVLSGGATITDPTDSLSTVTNLSVGVNEFEWEISSLCGTTRDTVIINLETQPDAPIIGLDTIICQNFTTLNATEVNVGIGEWSLLSGQGNITDVNNNRSPFTDIGLGDNILQWKVYNSCASDSLQVTITRFEIPSVADAGITTAICSDNITLEAVSPLFGDGLWSVYQGSGTFSDPTNPTSSVSNLSIGKNILQWEVSNACGINTDTVTITVDTPPSQANAGEEETICGGSIILQGNDPGAGYGEWTFVTGSGNINTPSDSTSVVNNLALGENILRWTVSNACNTSYADFIVNNVGDCEDEDSLRDVLIYFVPNSFTPDGDEHNQVFQPIFTSGIDPLQYTLLIFNRWGELIFESHNKEIGWKGTYGTNDRKAQSGVYAWKISFVERVTNKEHVEIGHVLLMR